MPVSLTTRNLGNLSGTISIEIEIEIEKDYIAIHFTQRPIGGPAADSGKTKLAKLRDTITLISSKTFKKSGCIKLHTNIKSI